MLVLFETAAGFAIFQLLDDKKLKKTENLFEEFQTPAQANKVVQLVDFKKFADSAEALQAGIALNEGKVCKPLKKLLKKNFDVIDQLIVWDAKLGSSIKEKLGIQVVSSGAVGELMRCIKSQVEALIPGLQEKELSAMSLGLAHNLARYKLKFSPDKVDTMIVQAISLLDDIDKELNNYVMRAREWYGWHFPELSKILTDNFAYIKSVMAMGFRVNAADTDFSKILPEEHEERVKEAAEISMGTEITEEDMTNINCLCEQIIELQAYRGELYEYLQNRMQAIAPNLTILVGDLVGARLISHAGSLLNLAKHPASTIQILGAEKALFRALKARTSTPKYGLIYHAQMVGQTSLKNKGKMSRMLAAKTALAVRYDALGEDTTTEMGIDNRAKLSSRIKLLEEGFTRRISGKGKSMSHQEPYYNSGDYKPYAAANDFKRKAADDESYETPKAKKIKVVLQEEEEETTEVVEAPTSEKKKKKKKRESLAMEVDTTEAQEEEVAPPSTEKVKKKKKRHSTLPEPEEEEQQEEATPTPPSSEKAKKKKKKSLP